MTTITNDEHDRCRFRAIVVSRRAETQALGHRFHSDRRTGHALAAGCENGAFNGAETTDGSKSR